MRIAPDRCWPICSLADAQSCSPVLANILRTTIFAGILKASQASMELQIAGGDVPALMTQIAQASKVNFTVTVISSRKLGTQAQELSGDPNFTIDPSSALVNATAAPSPQQ